MKCLQCGEIHCAVAHQGCCSDTCCQTFVETLIPEKLIKELPDPMEEFYRFCLGLGVNLFDLQTTIIGNKL